MCGTVLPLWAYSSSSKSSVASGSRQWAQATAWPAGHDVGLVAAQKVDVPVLERREPGHVLNLQIVVLSAEQCDSGVR